MLKDSYFFLPFPSFFILFLHSFLPSFSTQSLPLFSICIGFAFFPCLELLGTRILPASSSFRATLHDTPSLINAVSTVTITDRLCKPTHTPLPDKWCHYRAPSGSLHKEKQISQDESQESQTMFSCREFRTAYQKMRLKAGSNFLERLLPRAFYEKKGDKSSAA